MIPTAPNIVLTIVLSGSVTPHPIAYPHAAYPTKDGVFSITRTNRLPGRSFSSWEIVIPATIDVTNCGLWEKKINFEDNLKQYILEVAIIIVSRRKKVNTR